MKIIKKHPLLFLLLLTMLISCAHVELPHYGIVKDAETGEPLKDTLVFKSLYTQCLWPLPHVGSDYRGSIETITNENGRYWLSMDFTLSLPMCFAHSKNYTFFKPGYFKVGFRQYSLLWGMLGGWSLGEFDEKYDSGHISLYKMKHYLNYLPYKYPHKYNFSSYHIEDDSKYYKAYVESINKQNLNPAEKYGVFLRLPGKKISRIYSASMSYSKAIYYYIYDEIANEWLTVDDRGKVLESKSSKFPKWNFITSDGECRFIYADNNRVFYPVTDEENLIACGMEYDKGEIKSMVLHKGNISALEGALEHFFTIEDNGFSLCEYARNWREGDESLPYFLSCFTVNDNITDSKFMYLTNTPNHGLYIATQAPKYWHIYRGYDEKNKKSFFGEKLLSFDKEITAFTTDGAHFYIAFKGEGIKKFKGM